MPRSYQTTLSATVTSSHKVCKSIDKYRPSVLLFYKFECLPWFSEQMSAQTRRHHKIIYYRFLFQFYKNIRLRAMRVRRPFHKKTKSTAPVFSSPSLLKYLAASLYEKYSHSDKFYYLKELRSITKNQLTPASVKLKDLKTWDQSKQHLQKYVNSRSFSRSFTEAVNYYRYYEDIPRVFIRGVEIVIIKHVEAHRARQFRNLKEILEEPKKEVEIPQNPSQFMPLLQKQTKGRQQPEEDTLLNLKQQLSSALQQQSSTDSATSINFSIRQFSNLSINQWKSTQPLTVLQIGRTKQPKRIWSSMEFTKVIAEAANPVVRQQPRIRPILRMKTLNAVEKLCTGVPNDPKVAVRQKRCNDSRQNDKSNSKSSNNFYKSESRNSKIKQNLIPKHIRMCSETFAQEKGLNYHLHRALQLQRNSEIPRLKRRRKGSQKMPSPSNLRKTKI